MGTNSSSWCIGRKAGQTHYYSREQAARIGLPLTHMLTINFASTKIDPRQAPEAFGRLRRDHFNKWATRPNQGQGPAFQPTYVYVFENVRDGRPFLSMEDGEPHNVHAHLLLHCPSSRLFDLGNQTWGWVEAVTGGITGGPETIRLQPIPDRLGGYLLKGILQPCARLYARGQKSEPQGIIVGRRADTSRNLGPTARRAADQAAGVRRRLPDRIPVTPATARPKPS